MNPTAAMLLIGDEILSGRTRDANMHHLAGKLTGHGIDLKEARVVSDDNDAIVNAVRALAGTHDHVFTSGGIGPTHDDITASAIAEALKVHIGIREDALALLRSHYDRQGTDLNTARMRMARIPDEATLIENPISAAPGFSLQNVHVLAGVPAIFEAMIDSLLPRLVGGAPLLSRTLRLNRPEGELAGPLGELAARYPELSFGSYPFTQDGIYGSNIVVRGTEPAALDGAFGELKALFSGHAG